MIQVYNIPPKRKKRFLGNLSATKLLILINVVFFVITMLGMFFYSDLLEHVALKPSNIFQGKCLWTFLTSMFMHAPSLLPVHLLVNMFVLFSLGGMMENIIGKRRFFWFYLFSGLVAGALFVFLSYFFGTTPLGERIFGSPLISAVGASGAIFAIAGLFMILTPKVRFMIIFFPFFLFMCFLLKN